MKITMALKVTFETDEEPDGYPEEFEAIKGHPKTKRERHVYTAFARAKKQAEDEVIERLEDEGLEVARLGATIGE